MKPKTTLLWFILAVALATAVWVLEIYFKPALAGEKPLLGGFRAGSITGLKVIPAGAREISVLRTNRAWQLDQPMVYPAQAAAVEGLISAVEKLTPVMSFSAGEMSARKDADAEFGFSNPQFTLDFAANDQTWHLRVGNKTATGDGVYVRVVGVTGAFVTDTAWLQFLPHDASDWRDTTLVTVPDAVDWLVVTNGTQTIELRRDVTNHLWRMIRPQPARANNLQIVSALGQLRASRVSRFINDDPKADLTAYGLEPAALDVWLGEGTNLLAAIHGGKEDPGMPGEMYARREGWNSVVTTPKGTFAPWRGTVTDFRDPNVLEITAPVAEIEVKTDNPFTLRQSSNVWEVVGQKFPVDANQVKTLIKMIAGLQIADFVQDVVTPAGLQSYGLANASRQITLRSISGDTNSVIAQLLIGASTTNQVYVQCAGEGSVYAVAQSQLNQLLQYCDADYFRDLHVWKFSEADVARVTLRQNGKTREMIHNSTNDWSLAAGSQGVINNTPAMEETIHQLGSLMAEGWIGRKFSDSDIGITTNTLTVAIELKSGQKYNLEFGRAVRLDKDTTALAVATEDGERWAFVFPRVVCPLVAQYLTIPADSP